MKRAEMVRTYAGLLTAFVALVVYVVVMFRFTNKDMMEILVSYMAFVAAPSYLIPYMIGGEDEDAE